jgi:ParB-like chromosome segregation protein Spo0J
MPTPVQTTLLPDTMPRPRRQPVPVESIQAVTESGDTAPEALRESVRRFGVLFPVVLIEGGSGTRPNGRTHHLIADGRRRVLIARTQGMTTIPAILFPHDTPPAVVAALTLTTNASRSTNPLAEAQAVAALMREGRDEAAIAAALSLPPAYIARRARLSTLHTSARDALAAGQIPLSVAEAVSRLSATEQGEFGVHLLTHLRERRQAEPDRDVRYTAATFNAWRQARGLSARRTQASLGIDLAGPEPEHASARMLVPEMAQRNAALAFWGRVGTIFARDQREVRFSDGVLTVQRLSVGDRVDLAAVLNAAPREITRPIPHPDPARLTLWQDEAGVLAARTRRVRIQNGHLVVALFTDERAALDARLARAHQDATAERMDPLPDALAPDARPEGRAEERPATAVRPASPPITPAQRARLEALDLVLAHTNAMLQVTDSMERRTPGLRAAVSAILGQPARADGTVPSWRVPNLQQPWGAVIVDRVSLARRLGNAYIELTAAEVREMPRLADALRNMFGDPVGAIDPRGGNAHRFPFAGNAGELRRQVNALTAQQRQLARERDAAVEGSNVARRELESARAELASAQLRVQVVPMIARESEGTIVVPAGSGYSTVAGLLRAALDELPGEVDDLSDTVSTSIAWALGVLGFDPDGAPTGPLPEGAAEPPRVIRPIPGSRAEVRAQASGPSSTMEQFVTGEAPSGYVLDERAREAGAAAASAFADRMREAASGLTDAHRDIFSRSVLSMGTPRRVEGEGWQTTVPVIRERTSDLLIIDEAGPSAGQLIASVGDPPERAPMATEIVDPATGTVTYPYANGGPQPPAALPAEPSAADRAAEAASAGAASTARPPRGGRARPTVTLTSGGRRAGRTLAADAVRTAAAAEGVMVVPVTPLRGTEGLIEETRASQPPDSRVSPEHRAQQHTRRRA